MWDLPGPRIEPVSPALAGRFLTTVPPGKSPGALLFYCTTLVLDPHDFGHDCVFSRTWIIYSSHFWELATIPLPPISLPLKPRQTDLTNQQEPRRGSQRTVVPMSIHICNVPKAQIFSSTCSIYYCYRVSHWAEVAGSFSYFYFLLLSPFQL